MSIDQIVSENKTKRAIGCPTNINEKRNELKLNQAFRILDHEKRRDYNFRWMAGVSVNYLSQLTITIGLLSYTDLPNTNNALGAMLNKMTQTAIVTKSIKVFIIFLFNSKFKRFVNHSTIGTNMGCYSEKIISLFHF